MDITQAMEDFRKRFDAVWDADDGMSRSHVLTKPQSKVVLAIHEQDPAVLSWLTFFIAWRTLPCWELDCTSREPRRDAEAIELYLCEGEEPDWTDVSTPVESPHSDCLSNHTQSAADAVANCARYIRTGDPIYAIYCISNGETAYDHVFTGDHFREWLIDIAIPVALCKREMTIEEQEALRQDLTMSNK